jgi:hypothetical protein
VPPSATRRVYFEGFFRHDGRGSIKPALPHSFEFGSTAVDVSPLAVNGKMPGFMPVRSRIDLEGR